MKRLKKQRGSLRASLAAAVGCICLLGLATGGLASTAAAEPPEAPSVITWPEISGTPEPGQILICKEGTWTEDPTEYDFAWFRGETEIQTTSDYEVVEADRGQLIRCEVTASNSSGSTKAGSAPVKVPLIQHSLTVAVSGNGSGLVSSEANGSPSAIFCGLACLASFDEGTVVSLTASPDPGSAFGGWTGACGGTGSCVVSLDSDLTVGASFAATPSGGAPTGGGSVTSPSPTPKPKPLKCRRGFKKKKVHGKQRCVKVHKRKHHKRKR